jgi:hypothetical protein
VRAARRPRPQPAATSCPGWAKPVLVWGCQQNRERQDQPFEARYEVDGKHAQRAEAYLRRAYGLPRLQRYCCMWDSTRHSARPPHGLPYAMFMATETPVRTRAWPRIERFVQVDTRTTPERQKTARATQQAV